MKKLMSILLAAVMLFSVCAVTSSAQWSEAGYTVVIGDAVRFREGPGTDYAVASDYKATYGDRLGIINSDYVETDSSGREWFHSDRGWICMDYVTTYYSAAEISSGTINASGVAIRKGPTTNAPSVGSFSKNTDVAVLAKTHFYINNHQWYMVQYNSTVGWVAAEYVTGK